MLRVGLGLVLGLWLAAGAEPALTLTGVFHAGETKARNGERWLGLVPADGSGKYKWQWLQVGVKLVWDEIPAMRTGLSVSVKGAKPLILVRGVPGTGPQTTVRTDFIPMRRGILLERDGVADFGESCGLGLSASVLTLSCAGSSQRLVVWAKDDEEFASVELLWAGDADGDGRIDMALQIARSYSVTEYSLYLSSAARKGDLVGVAASQRTSGC